MGDIPLLQAISWIPRPSLGMTVFFGDGLREL
jgi:hypothetical protein